MAVRRQTIHIFFSGNGTVRGTVRLLRRPFSYFVIIDPRPTPGRHIPTTCKHDDRKLINRPDGASEREQRERWQSAKRATASPVSCQSAGLLYRL